MIIIIDSLDSKIGGITNYYFCVLILKIMVDKFSHRSHSSSIEYRTRRSIAALRSQNQTKE